MQEPNESILNLFFKFLINHQVDILVRVKPEDEFSKAYSVRYWNDRLTRNANGASLNIMLPVVKKYAAPIYIPYFYTDAWIDNDGVAIKELYRLVQEVRQASSDKERPIACHCASGVGRTGAFIASYCFS